MTNTLKPQLSDLELLELSHLIQCDIENYLSGNVETDVIADLCQIVSQRFTSKGVSVQSVMSAHRSL